MSVADQRESNNYGKPTITRLADAQVVDYYANTFSVMLRAEQTAGKFFMTVHSISNRPTRPRFTGTPWTMNCG